MPSLGYRQFVSNWQNSPDGGNDIVKWILNEGEDIHLWGERNMLRVTTAYW